MEVIVSAEDVLRDRLLVIREAALATVHVDSRHTDIMRPSARLEKTAATVVAPIDFDVGCPALLDPAPHPVREVFIDCATRTMLVI
jgi:hypothetical protein